MPKDNPPNPDGAPDWVYEDQRVTTRDRNRAIRAAASDKGAPLTMQDYEEWRETTNAEAPSSSAIELHWGWVDACIAVGVEPSQRFDYDLEDLLDEVIRVRDEIGEWPTITQYETHQAPGTPSRNWLYSNKPMGVSSWPAVVERARERAADE